MRRRLATLAAVSMFALMLGATPALAAGSPLTRATYQAVDLNTEGPLCGYTFTAGEVIVTFRTADAVVDPDTGEFTYIPAAHQGLRGVLAEKDGATYKVLGTEIYNDMKAHLTIKLMFVGQGGGLADSVNVVVRFDRYGDMHVAHENDSCHLYI